MIDNEKKPAPKSVVHIVDDDEAIRYALALLVETCGWQPMTYDSVEAFMANKPSDASPACLVLDLNMPGLNGADLLESVPLALPVIVISGYADSPLAERARRAGVRTILEKPFSDQLLVGHIREALKVAHA